VRLLLDTVAFLWLVSGSDQVTERVTRSFIDPENEVFLSSVSVWEIAVKYSLGKLPLPDSPSRIVPVWREQHGILPLPLDELAPLQLSALPSLHRDPFDRMLVCQAIVGGMTIATPDRKVQDYPVPTVW